MRAFLGEAKVGTEIYYPLGLHAQECFAYLGYRSGDLPETDRATQEVVALPIFPNLSAEEQQYVVDHMAAFFRNASGGHTLAAPKFLSHPMAAKACCDRADERMGFRS